jgi:hypothetical protein
MSLFDDLSEFGASSLESVSEGLGVFVKSYAQEKGEEKARDPSAFQQTATAQEPNGEQVTEPVKPSFSLTDKVLIGVGGVLFTGVVVYAVKV